MFKWERRIKREYRRLFLELPGGAIGAGEELGGFFVADDDFLFGIPFDGAFDQHGDQRQMARDGGVMSGLDGGDRRFAGLDAIEEVPMVVGGAVKLDLAQLLGQARHVIVFLLGRLESAAIDPYPAVRADPLCAAANIAVPAGNDHGDIVWILQVGAVFGAGVPDGVLGREFALGLDLAGPALSKSNPQWAMSP